MLATMYLCRTGLGCVQFGRLGQCSISTSVTRLVDDLSLITPRETDDTVMMERGPLPIITSRNLPFMPLRRVARQGWIENLDTVEEQKLGLVDLHPEVFGQAPRIDLIHENVKWQRLFRYINWNHAPNRMEKKGGGKKPWPQKGLGKSRHGSIRSPLWYHGGKAHGPRGPETHYYMLPIFKRVHGLCNVLSCKFAQDDMKIVDTLEIPTTDPHHLINLAKERHWGTSLLFVDDTDLMPKNITLATDSVKHMTLMPAYGLNVYSILKYETLIMTLAALNRIEEKLLIWLHTNDPIAPTKKYPGAHGSRPT